MFVADFIGSPPMNFLPFRMAAWRSGASDAPRQRRDGRGAGDPRGSRARRELALGVRPEHIRFDDASALRGAVFGAEYLGTTQIVTVDDRARAAQGARCRPTSRVADGDTVGLTSARERLSLFDKASGRAIRDRAAAREARHG